MFPIASTCSTCANEIVANNDRQAKNEGGELGDAGFDARDAGVKELGDECVSAILLTSQPELTLLPTD